MPIGAAGGCTRRTARHRLIAGSDSKEGAALTKDTASRRQTLLSQDEILALSGLEFMQAILDGRAPEPPIGAVMNFRLYAVARGEVTFRGAPQPAHFNPLSTVHGGWYGTILDSALACAVMTTVPKGSVYTTLEYKVNLTRSIPAGMEVDAAAWVEHAGRSTGVAFARITGVDDGKTYATGSTTCIIMRAG